MLTAALEKVRNYLRPSESNKPPRHNQDPKIVELEATLAEADKSAIEIETAMRAYNTALAKIKLQLDTLADKIESAEYFYHDNKGNVVPGVKAIEFDLERTQDPEKIRVLESQLAAAKARMARFVDLYEKFSKTIGPRRKKIERNLAQLDSHLIALGHQRKMTKKQLAEYIASKEHPTAKEEEPEALFHLAPDQQQALVSALETHLRVSQVEAFAEIDLKATKLLKDSVRRYRANPINELAVVRQALQSTDSALGEGEVDILYSRLSHRDSNQPN